MYFYYLFSKFFNIPNAAKIIKTVKRNIFSEAALVVDTVEDDGLKQNPENKEKEQ